MPWTIIYSPKAVHQLKSLQKDDQVPIVRKLEALTGDPYFSIRRLKDRPLYSVRIGEIRVILALLTDKVIICVVEVGHRKSVYQDI